MQAIDAATIPPTPQAVERLNHVPRGVWMGTRPMLDAMGYGSGYNVSRLIYLARFGHLDCEADYATNGTPLRYRWRRP